jgi:pyruvate formate lyase activating enzyme
MKREASFWKKNQDKKIQCNLCSHNCKINDGKVGICNVRKNENGKLFSLIYNTYSSIAADPIEKKPFYHFYPGTKALSMGTVGCNFKCDHCQNYSISTADSKSLHMQEFTPEKVVELIKQYSCQGVSYTYNEPTIWHEFCYDSAQLVKEAGFYTCYVTNGYINEEPLRELSPLLDAMNIDVKSFEEDFYQKICKARLEPVLNTCILAKELGIHIELTYLVIPTINDSLENIGEFCKWIINKLGETTPVHFSRFHPDHNMTDLPRTPMETLLSIYDMAKKIGILYPFLGNVSSGEHDNTYCPKCGNVCIIRNGFSIVFNGLKDKKCIKCGYNLPIVIDKYKRQKI